MNVKIIIRNGRRITKYIKAILLFFKKPLELTLKKAMPQN